MAIESGDILRVEFGGYINASQTRTLVVHHVAVSGTLAGDTIFAQLLAAATALHTEWVANFSPLQVDDVSLNGCRVQRIAPTPSIPVLFADIEAGGVTGSLVEPNTSVLFSLKSDTSGRAGLGRKYVPGIPVANTSNGLVGSGVINNWADAGFALFGSNITAGAASLQPIIWSPTNWEEVGTIISAASPVTAVLLDAVLRKQTRRDFKEPQYLQGS